MKKALKMLELTGMGSVLRGIWILYWLLAISAVALAIWKGKDRRHKAVWALIAVVVFGALPVKKVVDQAQRDSFARQAWTYFKKKCQAQAGEKVYRTVKGVRSILVVKPLPPARENDLYNQFWYGDPYSSATPLADRGISAARRLVMDWKDRTGLGIQKGLDFVELKDPSKQGYVRITRPESNDKLAVMEHILQPVSRFGVTWDDISTPEDRKYWVAGSRLRVVDLTDDSIVAERIGYLIESGFGSRSGGRRPWLTARGLGENGRSCPPAHDATDQWFITNVFMP